MQKKYMELSQNSVMHVFEHFCECIEEADFTSVLNCILTSLRNVRFVILVFRRVEAQFRCFYCEFSIIFCAGYRVFTNVLIE